jgi:polysaccharide export outer membrane protein
MRRAARTAVVLCFVALGAATSVAQIAPPQPPVAPPATPGAYELGAQDLLKITVFDEPDLTNSYRVDSDGQINFPLIGLIRAGGMTVRGLEETLTTELAAGYLRNPQVRVEIEQYRSRSVFVIGEVRLPGRITMTGSMSLIEALAQAGSPTPAASNELIVVHPRKPQPAGAPIVPDDDADAERTRVNIKDLQLGRAGLEIVLQDGDTVYVPKAQTFYVTGQVRNPGAYVLDPPMTVLQAISLAGGLAERGSDRGIRIIRVIKGTRVEIDARVTDLVQGDDTIQVRERFF